MQRNGCFLVSSAALGRFLCPKRERVSCKVDVVPAKIRSIGKAQTAMEAEQNHSYPFARAIGLCRFQQRLDLLIIKGQSLLNLLRQKLHRFSRIRRYEPFAPRIVEEPAQHLDSEIDCGRAFTRGLFRVAEMLDLQRRDA